MNNLGHEAGCFLVEGLRTKSKGSRAHPFCFWGLRMVEHGKQSEAASQLLCLAFILLGDKVWSPRKKQPQIPYLTTMQTLPYLRAASHQPPLPNGFPRFCFQCGLDRDPAWPQHPTLSHGVWQGSWIKSWRAWCLHGRASAWAFHQGALWGIKQRKPWWGWVEHTKIRGAASAVSASNTTKEGRHPENQRSSRTAHSEASAPAHHC